LKLRPQWGARRDQAKAAKPSAATTYSVVGRCLAPVLAEEAREFLTRTLPQGDVRWELLLAEANRQHCTPLWYARLRAHGLLGYAPADLQAYLARLYEANQTHNALLGEELAVLLPLLAKQGIPLLLLKGAATLADGLYRDGGARLMADLDLMVPEAALPEAERLLMMEGYVDDPFDRRHLDRSAMRTRHAHIAGLYHFRKNAAIELHYRVAYGQAGRVLRAGPAWRSAIVGKFAGNPVRWLEPTLRLLHNMLHATLPHREFLRGRLRLSDLAEFDALVRRYAAAIDFDELWQRVAGQGLLTEAAVYANLANRLMGTAVPAPDVPRAEWHLSRILGAAPAALADAGWRPMLNALRWKAATLRHHGRQLPGWTWRNPCYGEASTPPRIRLACFARHLCNPRSLQKLLRKPDMA
jgi:hypothetical protein